MSTKKHNTEDPGSCWNRAEEDEPVFVLLGRDESAQLAVMDWVGQRIKSGRNKLVDDQMISALGWILEAQEYRLQRGKK